MLVAFVTNPAKFSAVNVCVPLRVGWNPTCAPMLIRRLRHKLSADLLVTQHGEGYFLAADVC